MIGHWEIDTVKGDDQGRHTVVTMVERATGYTMMGKLVRHTAAETSRALHRAHRATRGADRYDHRGQRQPSSTATRLVEAATGVPFYFATPHHSWERGTNENTNGLIRQYLPKRTSMAHVTQADCDAIAAQAQLTTEEATRLPDTGGVLCTSPVGGSVRKVEVLHFKLEVRCPVQRLRTTSIPYKTRSSLESGSLPTRSVSELLSSVTG